MPLGYLPAGPLAATVRIHLGMVLLAALRLLISVATWASSQVRKLRWVDDPAKSDRDLRVVAAEPLAGTAA
jgi:hypothetical protein